MSHFPSISKPPYLPQGLNPQSQDTETADLLQPLKEALQHLSQLLTIDHEASSPLLTVYHIDQIHLKQSPSLLKEIAGLSRIFFRSLFNQREREHKIARKQQIIDQLEKSIDTIKTYYPSLEKLQGGSSSDRELLFFALEMIRGFNTLAIKVALKPPSLSERISRHLYQKAGWLLHDEIQKQSIDLPPLQAELNAPKQIKEGTWRQIASEIEPIALADKIAAFALDAQLQDTFKQEREILIVGTASLLENQGVSTLEALQKLREAPSFLQIQKKGAAGNRAAIISVRQHISAFPGEELVIKGDFESNPQLPQHLLPISQSFQFSAKTKQTGFPHPLQYTAFALSEKLVPFCPQRLQQLKYFSPVYKRKWQVAKELFPQGVLYSQAKRLLAVKKKFFDLAKKRFIAAHHQLAAAILKAANSAKNERLLTSFFQALQREPSPYSHLSEVYRLITELFIEKAIDHLYDQWPHFLRDMAQESSPIERRRRCEELYDAKIDQVSQELSLLQKRGLNQRQEATCAFIAALGPPLAQAAKEIFLQQLSEHLKFAAPSLSPFAKKVQIALYRQLLAFLEENSLAAAESKANLEKNREMNVPANRVEPPFNERSLFSLIEGDIRLFNSTKIKREAAATLVEELAAYYRQREAQ